MMKSKTNTTTTNPKGMVHWIALGLLVITYLVFSPAKNHDLTNWDDNVYIQENEHLQKLDWAHVKSMFDPGNPVSLNYHPLTVLSLSIDKWRSKPAQLNQALHATNIWLHAFNAAWVLYFIYLLTGGQLLVSTITALLFALNPLRVESVAWVAERKDVLYAFFFLLSIISYLSYCKNNKSSYLVLVYLFFIASLLAKSVAVVLPVVLVLIDYYRGEGNLFKKALLKMPMFLISLAVGILAYYIQSKGSIASFDTFSLAQRMMIGSYGWVMYVVKSLIPIGLCSYYPYPFLKSTDAVPVLFYLLPMVVVGCIALLVYCRKKERQLIFGAFFFTVNIMLVLQVISVGQVIMADRYAYMPSVGLFFIMAVGFERLKKRKKNWINMAYVLLVIYATVLIFITQQRIAVWKNSETLWTDVINQYPTVETAYKNRGNFLANTNRLNEALADYKTLVGLKTKDQSVYSNMGNIYGLLKQYDLALATYSQSIAMDTTVPDPYINRGITYNMMGNFPLAIIDFKRALAIKPDYNFAKVNLAYALLNAKQYSDAVIIYTALISNEAGQMSHYLNRGVAYFNNKEIEKAINDFEKCINADQYNVDALYNLSRCYEIQGDLSAAARLAMRAKSLGKALDPAFERAISPFVKS
ncbi:MAG: hypothetical protein RIQ89_2008 [Bacteroidota bacterium]|jgi:protein O-mannosyl-transferase